MKRSALRKLKDAALETALLVFLRPRFERYGEILKLSLDTANKIISAEILLLGEEHSLRIEKALYRIEQVGEETRVIIYDVEISRPWAQRLLEDHFSEISLKIPPVLRALAG